MAFSCKQLQCTNGAGVLYNLSPSHPQDLWQTVADIQQVPPLRTLGQVEVPQRHVPQFHHNRKQVSLRMVLHITETTKNTSSFQGFF